MSEAGAHGSGSPPSPVKPLVVGLVPHHQDQIARVAAEWASALGGATLYFAYADRSRYAVEHHADGTVRHAEMDPDTVDDTWMERREAIETALHSLLDEQGATWEFRYLAGSPDRALADLANAVDAAAILVGTREPGAGARAREFLDGSVAARLAHHQHRPVVIIPRNVIDWDTPVPWA